MIELKQGDCLELLKTLPDNSIDLIFCDPPYALGSEVIIRADGKPDYKKAVDFMNRWSQPDGAFWEEWFKEAKRVLKHGGHCLMFGMDRQLWFNCYYANLSGFTQKQSLYWYFISNFPKASDLSKNIDKYFGAERETNLVATKKGNSERFGIGEQGTTYGDSTVGFTDISKPVTPLAIKYEGIKYSVAPLKQTNETIMVFQKPYKTGSCLHDVLAMENGDDTITCGGVDIEGNRVGTGEDKAKVGCKGSSEWGIKKHSQEHIDKIMSTGRFPAQTYIDREASEIIDLQSGKLTSGKIEVAHKNDNSFKSYGGGFGNIQTERGFGDSGGASRILHKCDYEAGDYDLYHYCPKVSKSERNEGLEGFEEKEAKEFIQSGIDGRGNAYTTTPNTNNHPTVKPKALLNKILKLFKTPNDQVLLDPFMGSGSMGISAVETSFDYIGYELDTEYFKIAEARIANAQSKADERLL